MMHSTHPGRRLSRAIASLYLLACGLVIQPGFSAPTQPPPPIAISLDKLPERSVPELVKARPVPAWVRDDLLIAHLPPADWRQIEEFIKADYDVIAVNTLENWDRVGPRAVDFPAEEVARADKYLRRIVTMIHGAGRRAVFYMGPVQIPLGDKQFSTKHPEWMATRDDGTKSTDFVNIHHAEVVKMIGDQLAYLAREYKVDGVWFDGYSPVHLHTYDEATRTKYREESGGKEIPKKADLNYMNADARAYLRWHEQHFVQVADGWREAIRAVNPECVIYANYSANRVWYAPEWYMGEYPGNYPSALDLPSVELYWDNPGDALFQQFCYAFMQGVTRNLGARVWIQPQAHGTVSTPPVTELMTRGFEGAPWGVYTEFVEPTGREDHMRLYSKEVKRREAWWRQSEPVPYATIVASEQSHNFTARESNSLQEYFSHPLGAFRSALEKHIPVQVVTEFNLESGDVGNARVLVLPNVRVLSDRSAEIIRRFVEAGGGLVVSMETGLYSPDLKRRPQSNLADLIQADYGSAHLVGKRDDAVSIILKQPAHPILKDELIFEQEETAWRNPDGAPPTTGTIDLVSSCAIVTPRAGANVLATFKLFGDGQGEHPALITAQYGRGRVVYLPASFDKAMFFYPNTYIREIVVNSIRWAAGETQPLLEVHAPLLLATTFRYQPAENRYVVHLLNDHSSYGRHSIYQKVSASFAELQARAGFPDKPELRGTWPVREETIPLHDIVVTCRAEGITRATLQPENLDLPITRKDGVSSVTVPKLELYSMVVFE